MKSTKSSTHLIKLLAATAAPLLLLSSPARSAVISFSTYTATSASDTSWVMADADLSANLGGTAAASYGGVSFLGGTFGGALVNDDDSTLLAAHLLPNVGFAAAAAVFYAGTDLLHAATFQGDPNYVVRFDNLTVGQAYEAKFVVADNRIDGAGRTITVQATGSNTGSSSAVQFGYQTGEYAVVTATWTADSTTFDFAALNSAGGTQINAAQLKAVPEPASASMLGAALAFALMRRRRHQA